jgi:hypothetical protein
VWYKVSGIDIIENYNNYMPPFNTKRTINTLLKYTEPKYLSGIKSITLTNAASLSHDRRRETTWYKDHKVKILKSRGLYYKAQHGQPASIELFVDNILQGYSRKDLFLPIAQETIVGEVFFHELGHHIHYSLKPEYIERENVAEKYTGRLSRQFLKNRYWYLYPFFKLITKIYYLKNDKTQYPIN